MADRTNCGSHQLESMPSDLKALMELVLTRNVWGRGLSVSQMETKLASVLDEGRRHLVTVCERCDGELSIEFAPELGDVGRAFAEALRAAPAIGRAN